MKHAAFFVEHDVAFGGLQLRSSKYFRLLNEFDGRFVHGRTTQLQRARTIGAETFGDEVGIAPHHVDFVHRDTCVFRRDHRPCSHVALAVR